MSQETTKLPQPPVDAHVDLRRLPNMMVDVQRLLNCDRQTECSSESNWVAMTLWCKAWHLVPAGSLPNEDIKLAAYAGYGRSVAEWLKIKEQALRGFTLCEDGRLYHSYLSKVVNQAWSDHLNHRYKMLRDRLCKAKRAVPTHGDWYAAGCPNEWPVDSPPAPVNTSPRKASDSLRIASDSSRKASDSPRKASDSARKTENSEGIPVEEALKVKESKVNKESLSNTPTKPRRGEREVDKVQDEETEAVYKKLVGSGWKRDRQEARQIKDAFKYLGEEAFDQALDFCEANCKVWTIDTSSSTSYLLKHAQILMAHKSPGKEAVGLASCPNQNETPLQKQDREHAERKAQERGHEQLATAFRALPPELQAKLKTEFESSRHSASAKRPLSQTGWDSNSPALWGSVRGWLREKYPDLLAQLTGSQASSNVIQLPILAIKQSDESVDQEGLAKVTRMMAGG
jgi:hypothetical protein